MGYTTDFEGDFELDRPLTPEHKAYLTKFAQTRRMKRDAALTEQRPDPIRDAVNLPVGRQGAYFVGAGGDYGQEYSWNGHGEYVKDIVDDNAPPDEQPGLWCQWVPNEEGTAIVWDEGEKFYEYEQWLMYLVEHFLRPWGYVLNGEVDWFGEDREDIGRITIKDNIVKSLPGRVTYEERNG